MSTEPSRTASSGFARSSPRWWPMTVLHTGNLREAGASEESITAVAS
ncbi:hypothetical protein [Streptosporangium saharense]|uniref:Uncharacterized protein n=1 Tax=Streptosporangium saharense TaxID=1706840 RepID=A0A7W7QU68_9ACTN|nr:hypothetical protein [Streptosporangium saharense]MBB4919818.1 hypothetical protein [Streptosporangium saharense]